MLEEGLADAAKKAGIKTRFYRAGSMFCTYFTDKEIFDCATAKTSDTAKFARFFTGMLKRELILRLRSLKQVLCRLRTLKKI